MGLAGNIKKSIQEGIEQERKSPYSVRLYNILALIILGAAVLLTILSACLFAFLDANWLWLWSFCFAFAFFCAGFLLGVKQRLRGGFLLSKIACFLCILCLLLFIGLLIFVQVV